MKNQIFLRVFKIISLAKWEIIVRLDSHTLQFRKISSRLLLNFQILFRNLFRKIRCVSLCEKSIRNKFKSSLRNCWKTLLCSKEICIENEMAYEMLFRWRRYDTAPGAAISAIPNVREIDGPTDTFRIDVSFIYLVIHVYCLYCVFNSLECFAMYRHYRSH